MINDTIYVKIPNDASSIKAYLVIDRTMFCTHEVSLRGVSETKLKSLDHGVKRLVMHGARSHKQAPTNNQIAVTGICVK